MNTCPTSTIIDSKADFVNLIKEREMNIVRKAQDEAKKMAETEMALLEFELLYSVTVSKKQMEKTAKMFKNHRKTKWQECLKKASGNEEKAFAIYCDF